MTNYNYKCPKCGARVVELNSADLDCDKVFLCPNENRDKCDVHSFKIYEVSK